MKETGHIRWLYRQLPELVRQGVLTEETAARIRRHYEDATGDVSRRKRAGALLLGTLGSLLVGGGIILIVGHNWDEFSRPVRTLLSFLPLVVALVLAGYTLVRRWESTVWREGSALFLALSVGATLGLVGQTYHIPYTPTGLLLRWMLLILPVAYLFRSTAAFLVYLTLIPFWVVHALGGSGNQSLFWVWTALAAPLYVRQQMQRRDSPAALVQEAGLALCLAIGILPALHESLRMNFLLPYSALFASMYLGSMWLRPPGEPAPRIAPFRIVGFLGGLTTLFIATFRFVWAYIESSPLYDPRAGVLEQMPDYVVLALLFTGALVLLLRVLYRGGMTVFPAVVAAAPLAIFVGYLLNLSLDATWSALWINVYVLGLGIAAIAGGVRSGRGGLANLGMACITLLAVFRFFDTSFAAVTRGTAFVVAGLGFLFVNYLSARQKKDGPAPAADSPSDPSDS